MDATEKRAVLVRARARAFAASVKADRMAHKLPDELIDWLEDSEIPTLKEHLQAFGLQQRADWLWEPKT